MNSEEKGQAGVAWLIGTKHQFYEDAFRLLPKDIPLVGKAARGELFGVFDGIGTAPRGRSAAQTMADQLVRFYKEPDRFPTDTDGLQALLLEGNAAIFAWGMVPGTDKPLGGCAGSIAWLHGPDGHELTVLHAGDTAAVLVSDGAPRLLTLAHAAGGLIARYFGQGPRMTIDAKAAPCASGDTLLLISDGVTKSFKALEAGTFVAAALDKTGSTKEAAMALVAESRRRGSGDDITAIIVEIE